MILKQLAPARLQPHTGPGVSPLESRRVRITQTPTLSNQAPPPLIIQRGDSHYGRLAAYPCGPQLMPCARAASTIRVTGTERGASRCKLALPATAHCTPCGR